MGTYTNYSKLEVDGTISSSVQGELIGTFTSMPSASALNEGKTIYYTGATSGNYVQNTFYTCTKSGSTYSWTSASPKQISVDSALSETSTNPVQNKVIATKLKEFATKDDIATVYKPKGSVASSSLPTNPRIGDVYNLTDNSSYGPAGTNVVYTEDGTWDALAGIVDISGKQDKISSGTGISISGNTVSLATSGVTAGTKGSTTAVPVITVDAYGRVTSIGSETIYPPTTVGTSGQIWVSDGSGAGTWQSKDTTPTSGSTNAITSGAVHTALAGKQNNLSFDSTPTQNSSNPVTSGGVYNALAGKQDKLTFDSAPKSGSSNPVTSGGIYTAIEAKQSKLTFDSTPTSGSNNPVTSGGIFSAINGVSSEVSALQTTVAGKQDALSFDSTPTSGSGNPVTSGGIYTAISNKMDKVTSVGSSSKPIYINSSGVPTACSYSIGTAASYGVTTSVTSGSSSLVTSGAVYTAINESSSVPKIQDFKVTVWNKMYSLSQNVFTSTITSIVLSKNVNTTLSGTLYITTNVAKAGINYKPIGSTSYQNVTSAPCPDELLNGAGVACVQAYNDTTSGRFGIVTTNVNNNALIRGVTLILSTGEKYSATVTVTPSS